MEYIKTQSGELINQAYIVKIVSKKSEVDALMADGSHSLIGVYGDNVEDAMAYIRRVMESDGSVDMTLFNSR